MEIKVSNKWTVNKVRREGSLADKVGREATHPSVTFPVLVVGQHHCWFFCYLKNVLPLLRGSFDFQVLLVPDVIIPLSGSELPREKDIGPWLLLWARFSQNMAPMAQSHLLPQQNASQALGRTVRQAVVNACFSSSEAACASYAHRK